MFFFLLNSFLNFSWKKKGDKRYLHWNCIFLLCSIIRGGQIWNFGVSVQLCSDTLVESFSIMDCQLLSQSLSNNLSNEDINTGVSREIIFQKYIILAFWFMFCLEDKRNTSILVFITKIFWLTFDVIIDVPYLTLLISQRRFKSSNQNLKNWLYIGYPKMKLFYLGHGQGCRLIFRLIKD